MVWCAGIAWGQDTAEVSTKETAATFSAHVNIVTVPVVVRDRNSNPVSTLKKEDFLVFDNGKPQAIGRFTVEKNGVSARAPNPPAVTPPPDGAIPGDAAEKAPAIPDRFLAFIFDDLHLEFADLAQARKAVLPYLDPKNAGANTRIALFTTSGQNIVDFTNDLDKLRDDLNRIIPRHREFGSRGANCPPYISAYVADQILNRNNQSAIQAIITEEYACLGGPPPAIQPQQIEAEAQQVLSSAEMETHTTLGVLRNIVRRMSGMPGQRIAVLVSPGYLITTGFETELTEVINLAVRQNVVVNTLDARGLYTDATLDASRATYLSSVANTMQAFDRDDQLITGEVLGEIADGTGGTWFHNNNDLGEGFRRTTEAPEVYYVIAYSPGDLKNDGRFHKIKVALKDGKGFTIQARRGYYAPTKKTDEADQAKEDIESALFSRDEIHTIPVSVHTQFFKTTDTAAKLAVITHIDLAHLRLRKSEGRNSDDLVVVSALFDSNGNFVTANQETLQLRLKDEHLEARLKSGVTLKSDFDVKPGAYLVRLVVRDTEGQEIASTNGSVEIP